MDWEHALQVVFVALAVGQLLFRPALRAVLKAIFSSIGKTSVVVREENGSVVVHDVNEAEAERRHG